MTERARAARGIGARVGVCVGVLGGATAVAFLPLCDLLFGCGCEWPWAGGIRHCNIYDPAAAHCPWCVYPRSADLSLAALLSAETAGAWVVARRSQGWLTPLLGSVLAGGAMALFVRAFVAWWAGYPL